MSPTDDPTTITGRWTNTEGMTMSHNTPPSFDKTYRRADGQTIAEQHDWVNSLEYLSYTVCPVEIIEETWTRTAVRTFWHMPPLYACEIGRCDNDAAAWERRNHVWYQVCEHHRLNGEPSALAGEIHECCEWQCRQTLQERSRDQ